MRKVLLAAVAALTLGAGADRAQAGSIGAAIADAFDGGHRRCQVFDPNVGEWIDYWVPGQCLSYAAPGYFVGYAHPYHGRSYRPRRSYRRR